MSRLKYLGFFGFLGCLYFVYGELPILSGFIFFSFFRLHFLDKLSNLKIDEKLSMKTAEIGRKIYFIPLVTLFIIANGNITKMEFIVSISILTIVITFIGSSMIPYFYARSYLRKIQSEF